MLRTVSLFPAFEFAKRKEKMIKKINFTRNWIIFYTNENKIFQKGNY